MNTHTPGPWTYDRDLMVRADAGKVEVCEVFARLFDRMLCLSDDRVRYNEEATANARLIATAPDMLEALKHVWRWHDQLSTGDIARIAAIIAKAQEQTP